MKHLSFTLLLPLLMGSIFHSCSHVHSEDHHQSDAYHSHDVVPTLLVRNEKIGTQAEQDRTREIYHELKHKVEHNPSDWDSHLKLARLFMIEARVSGEHGHYFHSALHIVDDVISSATSDDLQFEASFLKASILLSQHQFQEALVYGNRALSYRPNHALVHGALTDAYVELGQYDKAIKTADRMVEIRPDLRSYARISYLREIHGDIDGAIEAMKLAVAAGLPGQEDAAWCRLQLGELYARYGDLVNAEEQFLLTLAERPNYPYALAAKAHIEQKKGNIEVAEKLYDEAIALMPDMGFLTQKASLYHGKDQWNTKQDILNEILHKLDHDDHHHHEMGLEYASLYMEQLGDAEKALPHGLKEYKFRPKNIDVNKLLAAIYFKMGEIDLAHKHILQASSTNSQDPQLLCLAGLIQYTQGHREEGVKQMNKAFSYDPYLASHAASEAKKIVSREG